MLAAIENGGAMRSALKGDGRKRILQFVSDAPGDFVPGRGLLGAQQFAGVFENHSQNLGLQGLRGQRGHRDREMQDLRGRVHVDLAGGDAGAAGALHQVVEFRRRLRAKTGRSDARRARLAPAAASLAAHDSRAECGHRRCTERTPVGILSRMVSVKRRRLSSSRLLASSSCIISLKARTSVGQFVDGFSTDAVAQVAFADFAPRRPARAEIGEMIWRESSSAIQVATKE